MAALDALPDDPVRMGRHRGAAGVSRQVVYWVQDDPAKAEAIVFAALLVLRLVL
jgi:hypothetical protein